MQSTETADHSPDRVKRAIRYLEGFAVSAAHGSESERDTADAIRTVLSCLATQNEVEYRASVGDRTRYTRDGLVARKWVAMGAKVWWHTPMVPAGEWHLVAQV